jgi:predicted P-loop ATPase
VKRFLSAGWDEIREPYGRRAVGRPRMTAFCGSVNSLAFLNDSSGSRRFWPIEVTAIDWSVDVNWQQLWAQAYVMWQENADFNLTLEDKTLSALEAEGFHLDSPEADMCEAHIAKYGDRWDVYAALNLTEVVQSIGIRHPNKLHNSEVRQWLEKNRGKDAKIGGRKRTWAWPLPPETRGHVEGTVTSYLSETLAKKWVLWRGKPK